MEQLSNKTTVLQFYKQVVGQRDSSLIDQYVSEDYIQHSPMGKDGRQGLHEMVAFLQTLPPSKETVSPIKRSIGDGDMVMIQLDINFMGKRMVVIDIFRVQDGMLAEHWDAVQEIDPDNDTMTNGTSTIDENTDTVANKQFVNDLYKAISANENIDLYVATNCIEHNISEPLVNYPNHQIDLRRSIGEGDMVVVQSELIKDGISYGLYDILRIADRQVVEHWSVQQVIPEVMQHSITPLSVSSQTTMQNLVLAARKPLAKIFRYFHLWN